MVHFGGQYTYQQYVAARQLTSGIRGPFRLMLIPIAAIILLALVFPLMEGADPASLAAFGIFLVLAKRGLPIHKENYVYLL